jgi:hypothetical protein
MRRGAPPLLLVLAVLLSLLGVGAFIYLFAPIFNIYWFILAPIILALYQLPAVYMFLLWKRRARNAGERSERIKKEKNAPDGI